jgi:hypothetical protein
VNYYKIFQYTNLEKQNNSNNHSMMILDYGNKEEIEKIKKKK